MAPVLEIGGVPIELALGTLDASVDLASVKQRLVRWSQYPVFRAQALARVLRGAFRTLKAV